MKIEQKIDQAYISADYFPDSEIIPMLNILSEFSLNLQQVSTGKTSNPIEPPAHRTTGP
jgi:hypothetical protein